MPGILPSCIKFPRDLSEAELHRKPRHIPTDEELAAKFESLLEAAKSESEVHEFFERFPHVLPGVDRFHNGPMRDIVLTKLPLGNEFVTDFAFVSENSQNMQVTLVEIESPRKHIFLKNGSFSREYLDAKQQLADWNNWGQQNLRDVLLHMGPLGKWVGRSRWHSELTMRSILVIGRRSELWNKKRQERWAAENALRAASMSIMTYDRILERIQLGAFWPLSKRVLVCKYSDRDFHVKRIAISDT